MANATLLQLIDQVSGELGLAQPSVVIGSAVNQTMQLLALAQRLGKDLVREHEWSLLHKAYVFQTTAAYASSGTTTAGSKSVTGIGSTSTLVPGDVVSGIGIAPYSEVVSGDSSTAVTMNMPATASGSVSLTFARQDYAFPADYDRMIDNTSWDRSSFWPNNGSRSSQAWQALQAGIGVSALHSQYRIYNGRLRIFPAPTTVRNEAYEYVSTYWVINYGEFIGADTLLRRAKFVADDDSAIFPDDLMLAGIKYYFLKAKKLDYAVEMAEFNDILATRKAQDVPHSPISMAHQTSDRLIYSWNVPEGNWEL